MPAYNNYTPMYQPYYNPYQYQQPIPQQTQQPVQQQMPTVQQNNPSSIIWVRNAQEAAMYPLAPNNAVALWDSASPVIYLKQADASGKPTMKTYDLVERTEQPVEASKSDGGTDNPYATKADVAALAGVVKGFDSMIASMKGEIEKMNSDLYGIAGSKKKSTKKAESEDET